MISNYQVYYQLSLSPFLVHYQPPIPLSNHVVIALAFVNQVLLDISPILSAQNVIEPEIEEDFLPKNTT